MRSISPTNLALLQARRLVARDFLWIVARERGTNVPAPVGFWSDVENVSAAIVHPDTGGAVTRDWYGSGTLIAISDIPLVSNITVQTVTIQMSQIDDLVEQTFRLYDLKQARVEIYRGLFDPDSRQMTAPAECRFIGFVDEANVDTPKEGEAGALVLTCKSHTQEMTRSNPDTRSDASQRRRSATDNFYQDTAVVGDWELFWGSEKGKIPSQPKPKRKKFLGIF
jgi:hypothetical protein